MIIVFPLLTDESVSTNVLPGICKALEKFILVYEIDSIMKMTGLKILRIGGEIAKVGAAVGGVAAKTTRENANLSEQTQPFNTPPNKPGSSGSRPPTAQEEEEQRKREKHAMDIDRFARERTRSTLDTFSNAIQSIKQAGTVEVNAPKDYQAISVEPTYITVTTTVGTRLIGIKVIPVPVKSHKGFSLAELLTLDASLNFMDSLVFRIERKAIRAFWALCRGIRIPFIRDRVISGDPVKDILWASSFHRRYVFCLINFSDISDSEFFKNAGGIHKLHSIGWNSIIAADDVNKRALFCMKEFHGLCSTVPYSFIYASLGKEHTKVYDSLEDVKKSASPFFKLSVNSKRVFGESMNTLKKYLKGMS